MRAFCWEASHRLTHCPQAFFCAVQKLCKFINRNVRSAICKQFERTRPRSFRSTGKTIPSKFNCPQFWAEILSSLSQKQSPSSALAECLRLPYESCSRAQPHVQMSDVTGTWQSKSKQNMRATNRSSCTDHCMSYVFGYFGFCNSAPFIEDDVRWCFRQKSLEGNGLLEIHRYTKSFLKIDKRREYAANVQTIMSGSETASTPPTWAHTKTGWETYPSQFTQPTCSWNSPSRASVLGKLTTPRLAGRPRGRVVM